MVGTMGEEKAFAVGSGKVLPLLAGALFLALGLCGCTSPQEYIANGLKVGPNYAKPPAPVAKNWIDASDKRVRSESDDLSHWWTVFNDPVLDSLICFAYQQNLTLREAGFRVLQARAQLGIARGELFPQLQTATGDWNRNVSSVEDANRSFLGKRFFSQFDFGFNLAWELDFWGRFRRAIESASDSLDASVENYDDVLVTLLGDVATAYVQIRTFQKRIEYANENVKLQRETLKKIAARVKFKVERGMDEDQQKSLLAQTEAQVPEFEIGLRLATNQLCILLGIPPEDLQARLGNAPIPTAPKEVAVGIPADLLRRRPDVRRAERQAAAQCAQIGVAEAEFYPHIFINGSIGASAQHFKDLFVSKASTGTIGPSFQWEILNYGRILNNVRLQDATFQQLVTAYQNTVLNANEEVENGLVTFLRGQERTRFQADSVKYAEKVVNAVFKQYELGTIEYTRVLVTQQNLVQQQDTLAQAQGEIATGLIQVYRALGGGWQIRVTGCPPILMAPSVTPPSPTDEQSPAPRVLPKKAPN
jgi:NodT family efflux transporter outer membrane factor (OMF) lipoprotein